MMPAVEIPPPLSPPPRQTTYFKEEREDGAVYSVSLKKVRYRSSHVRGLIVNMSDMEPVSHLQWETIRVRTIKAGTLVKLVEHLAAHEEIESGYLITFLSTYRSFAETAEVLELLLSRYRTFKQSTMEQAEVIQEVLRGVCKVLITWLDQFSLDFNDPPHFPCLTKLLQFVQKEMEERHRNELAKKVQCKLDRYKITPYDNEGVQPVQPVPSWSIPIHSHGDESLTDDTQELEFLDISPELLAEQLTLVDAELFKRVTVWHCLGSVWSKNRTDKTSPTVQATISQFNAVSLRVISTILNCTDRRTRGPAIRAQFISHWIAVARECRDLKNFSSLKAILSALQSASIHRLKKTWNQVSKDSMSLFEELSSIFSDDKNQQISRELLMREGTAKLAEADISSNRRPAALKKRRSRHMDLGVIDGTVPYLGTFLTDLMMMDTVYPNVTEDGLINFDKKRKEFEIIAQIKLLQEAAKNYFIRPDAKIREWFDNVQTFTETESYNTSCQMEKTEAGKLSRRKHASMQLRRMFSEPDISKLCLSTEFLALQTARESMSTENSPVSPRKHNRNNSSSSSSSSSSGVSSSSEMSTTNNLKQLSVSLPRTINPEELRKPSRGAGVRLSLPGTLYRPSGSASSETRGPKLRQRHIVRVAMDDDACSGVMYKGIWLADDERAPGVVRTCMTKHGIENEDPKDYELVQVLFDEDELVIPYKANVYYTLNPNALPLTFKLRKKKKKT